MGGWHHLGCIHCSCQPFAASPEGLGTVTIPSSALGRSLCAESRSELCFLQLPWKWESLLQEWRTEMHGFVLLF